ncbi:hypothetical protein FHX42_002703 [Saccharopolyspora lacisalsi]|uniref:DUF1542 domain-containing protein n=1 Tax=Halosaccharopolyspora lacisalsi TaxID=1000566 RepID=A0A839DTQ1_9PSEU|nr:hypothetical protein [Halosaccharopolyspora lacisalsi]MBA8825352.1 hypothetical protein [Halosaccharopolyspora lacisalsi]
METFVWFLVLVVLVAVAAVWWFNHRATVRKQELDDIRAEARRWVERLGGQILNLVGTNEAAKQALVDASERHTAAVSQLEQATTVEQSRLTTQTALEGLYYVRGARVAMDMDPGPELPDLAGQQRAGRVTEHREVDVDGQRQVASPEPGERTPHYYPGGTVAGRPVPQGWYSEPWWKPALAAGAWGMGSFLLMGALFSGMDGVSAAAASPEEFAGGDMGDGMGGDMGEMGGPDDMGGGMDGFDFGDLLGGG